MLASPDEARLFTRLKYPEQYVDDVGMWVPSQYVDVRSMEAMAEVGNSFGKNTKQKKTVADGSRLY